MPGGAPLHEADALDRRSRRRARRPWRGRPRSPRASPRRTRTYGIRVGHHRADRLAGRGRERRHGDQEHELLPALDLDRCRRPRCRSGGLGGLTNASSVASGRPSARPNRSRANWLVWRMTPGSRSRSRYRRRRRRPRRPGSAAAARPLSMPFCSVMTRVAGPTSGRACSAAASVSHSLTANSTMSTGPTAAGSSVALTGRQVQVAEDAVDREAVLAQGRKIRAARDEAHVVSRGREPRAEITADRPCRHRRNAHEEFLLPSLRPGAVLTHDGLAENAGRVIGAGARRIGRRAHGFPTSLDLCRVTLRVHQCCLDEEHRQPQDPPGLICYVVERRTMRASATL